jgi:hypothetical protein
MNNDYGHATLLYFFCCLLKIEDQSYTHVLSHIKQLNASLYHVSLFANENSILVSRYTNASQDTC